MHFKWLFRKKLSIEKAEKLLAEYCELNGFGDKSTHWKSPTHRTNLIPYRKRANTMISNNWVAYHPVKRNDKYSIWIDLRTEEIREVLRNA